MHKHLRELKDREGDEDFGPFFIKFCSYFPYTAKLCINGHEYLKRQLSGRGVDFEPLDNGLLKCSDPALAQRLDSLRFKIRCI